MSITRAQLSTYIGGMLTQPLTAAGISSVDSTGNMKEPIDDALLALGVDPTLISGSGAFTALDARAAYATVKYYALMRIRDAVLHMVDIAGESPQVTAKRSQFVTALNARIAEAKVDSESFATTTTTGGWSRGSLNLNYIEPDDTDESS
jgi:hypothetical protein